MWATAASNGAGAGGPDRCTTSARCRPTIRGLGAAAAEWGSGRRLSVGCHRRSSVAARTIRPTGCGHAGSACVVLDKPESCRCACELAKPEHVGIDRLLDAVAANSRRPPGVPAVIIDAGSAVTVDLVDAQRSVRRRSHRARPAAYGQVAARLHGPLAADRAAVPGRGDPAVSGHGDDRPPWRPASSGPWPAASKRSSANHRRLLTAAPVEVFLTGGDAALAEPVLPESSRGRR